MDKYKKFASDRKDDIVNLLSELVAIPSVMGEAKPGYPFGEAPAKALVAMLDAAKALGFAVNNVDNCYGTADYLPPTVLTRQNLQFFVTWTSCRKEKAGVMNLLSVPKRTVFSMAEA